MTGPAGQQIRPGERGMAVPPRWLAGVNVDRPAAPEMNGQGYTFRMGDQAFQYDRLGLRRA